MTLEEFKRAAGTPCHARRTGWRRWFKLRAFQWVCVREQGHDGPHIGCASDRGVDGMAVWEC